MGELVRGQVVTTASTHMSAKYSLNQAQAVTLPHMASQMQRRPYQQGVASPKMSSGFLFCQRLRRCLFEIRMLLMSKLQIVVSCLALACQKCVLAGSSGSVGSRCQKFVVGTRTPSRAA